MKEPRNRIPRFFGFDQKMILCLAVAAQNIDQLVGNHVLDSLTSRLQVLARVEVIRMLSEVLADRAVIARRISESILILQTDSCAA